MLKRIICLLFILLFTQTICHAELTGFVSHNTYSKKDVAFLLKKANDNLKMYKITQSKEMKDKYLKEALRNYYICTKVEYSNIEAHIGLGKVYDEMGVDKYAKLEFNSAYNIDNKNPKLNYYYGDFYYKRHQLNLAQNYFERAYKFGYDKNEDLNLKMSKAYTKLAQPQKAEEHLKIAKELSKKEKTKLAVNSAIKQASNVGTIPAVLPKNLTTEEVKNVSVKKETELKKDISTNNNDVKKNSNRQKFDDIVVSASRIKMIDDYDMLKPMYYLFIK